MPDEKIKLKNNSETLFIPLYGKANISKYGDILSDPKAKEIVAKVDYDFSQNEQNRFLDIYMGIRAAIIDGYARRFIEKHPDAVVIHLGCGLDSRIERIERAPKLWIDLDLPAVIELRRQFYSENGHYKMLAASATELGWIDDIDYHGEPVLVIAEGLTMYLSDEENRALFAAFRSHFSQTDYVFDAYSVSAVRYSKRKNPVNKMGAVIRWGLDEPELMESAAEGAKHVETKYFTGEEWESKLSGVTRFLFHVLYGNRLANKLYRIYYYQMRK